jgi:hypothetical protein
MGYGFYEAHGRPCGYLVLATCDKRGCDVEIDRGLGWLCGDAPHSLGSDEPGCGRYYCAAHLGWVGDRGGCSHRRRGVPWGVTLSCMAPSPDGMIVCCDRAEHEGLHAWEPTP